jgi:outer membrane receptor for ferrienterochelin and colicin
VAVVRVLSSLAAVLMMLVELSAVAGTSGILEGIVRDRSNQSPIVGVNIVVVGTTLGAVTDGEGYFRVTYLRGGSYTIRFSSVGYAAVIVDNVVVVPDTRTRLDMALEQTAIELDPIEIRYERPFIQLERPSTAFSIGEVKLERLPANTYQEILHLQPGTTIEGNVRGGKTNEVLFLVDGLPVQDVIGGGLGAELPKSSITGITLYTGGFEAEYGNALSGVVNVITKSGGEVQSLAVRLERDSWIPSRWNKKQDRLNRLEVVAHGPFLSKKASFFSANTYSMSDTRWWQEFDQFFRSPILQEFSGFSKLDLQTTPTSRLALHAIYSLRSWRDYEFSWRYNLDGLPERKRGSIRSALQYSNAISERSSFTASASVFFLQSRIGGETGITADPRPYEYDFYLRYVVAGKKNWWADTRQWVYTLKGDMTTHIGDEHIAKVGVEINQYDIMSNLVKMEPQLTYFGKPIIDAPLLNYSNFYRYHPRSGSVFIQDNLSFSKDGSNLSAGLRWDFLDPTASRPIVEYIPTRPDEYEQQVTRYVRARFKHQISPRIGASFPASPSTFFFLNIGRYFQFPLFDQLYSGIHPARVRSGTRTVLTGNPDLEPERVLAWEVGIRHSFTDRILGSTTFFRKNFENQIDSKTLVPFDSKAAGDYGFASYVNNATANATGIEFVISREVADDPSGSLSYTYMVTEGTSEYINQTINYAQWGFPLYPQPFPLSWDQRHTIKLDFNTTLPWDVQSNVILIYNTPRPYSYYPTRDGFDPVDSTYVFIPNNRRMGELLFLNARISKQVSVQYLGNAVLTIYADGRNLLDRKNPRWVDSNGRVGGELRDPSAFFDPRRVLVGLKYEF